MLESPRQERLIEWRSPVVVGMDVPDTIGDLEESGYVVHSVACIQTYPVEMFKVFALRFVRFRGDL